MLQITDRAAGLLRSLRAQAQLPDSAGIRVYTETAPSGEASLSIGFTPDPMPADLVSDHDGLRVFVAPEIADPLASAIMDVIAENGESQLVFRPADVGGDAADTDGRASAPE